MKIERIDPPRRFSVGKKHSTVLADCAHIYPAADEQVTFYTESGGEYDVVRKSWGFYATPSLNGRLKRFGLSACLVKSPDNTYFVHLVEAGHEAEYAAYLEREGLNLVCRLDTDAALSHLEAHHNP